MPVYEYECKSCGTRFEKVQPITADPITECVNCGQGPIRRIFHPVGVIFKGSGWYITDSRKSASASGADKSSSAKSDDSKDGKSSGESNKDSKSSSDSSSAESTTTKATVADTSSAD
ncbi:MAG TPA: FmdB family zinc ribbon protein [Chloroflexia bacterium]|nr:FmdB family zinc ribbon protein [Chloroflexia bacterium]